MRQHRLRGIAGGEFRRVEIERTPLRQHLSYGRSAQGQGTQAVGHIGHRRMNAGHVQNQLAVEMRFATGSAEKQEFIRPKPDKMPVANRNNAVVVGQCAAPCMIADRRQHVTAAAQVDLAKMRQFGDDQPGLATIGVGK